MKKLFLLFVLAVCSCNVEEKPSEIKTSVVKDIKYIHIDIPMYIGEDCIISSSTGVSYILEDGMEFSLPDIVAVKETPNNMKLMNLNLGDTVTYRGNDIITVKIK